MDVITVLLVLFILDGEAHTFAVKFPDAASCAAMEMDIAVTLPKLLGRPPQLYAARCAPVVPFMTAI